MRRFNPTWVLALSCVGVVMTVIFWPSVELGKRKPVLSYYGDIDTALALAHEQNAAVFLGSSESCDSCNVPSAINSISDQSLRPAHLLARSGMGPFSYALLVPKIVNALKSDIPMIWLLNPVYFLEAQSRMEWMWIYDLIGDRNAALAIKSQLPTLAPKTSTLLISHLKWYNMLWPVILMQQKIRAAMGRTAEQYTTGVAMSPALGGCDPHKAVLSAGTQWDQKRLWMMCRLFQQCDVNTSNESPSMLGSEDVIHALGRRPQKAAVVWLPVNIEWYVGQGMNQVQFLRDLTHIRMKVEAMARSQNVLWVDLSSDHFPATEFADRLHLNNAGTVRVSHVLMQNSDIRKLLLK